MTKEEILSELKLLGTEKQYNYNLKKGAGENQFGVKMGDIRKLAKMVKPNLDLALDLWETENLDARQVAILLMKPKELSLEQLNELVHTVKYFWVADWLNNYIVKKHPESEKMREKWMQSDHPMAQRAGWNLTSILAAKKSEVLDYENILNQLEKEMPNAHPQAQWTMNFTLVEIGINHPDFREKALTIGEKLGVYRDYPVSKGCTSPFAPIWIGEMVKRQN